MTEFDNGAPKRLFYLLKSLTMRGSRVQSSPLYRIPLTLTFVLLLSINCHHGPPQPSSVSAGADAFCKSTRAILRSSNSPVVVGHNRWVFLSEELIYATSEWPDQIKYILTIQRFLRDRGIDFVLVPIPMKIDVYPEQVTGQSVPLACPKRAKLIDSLAHLGVHTIDLLPLFLKRKNTCSFYTDYGAHYTNTGIIDAARIIADTIRALHPELAGKTKYKTRDSVYAITANDLEPIFRPYLPAGFRALDTISQVEEYTGISYKNDNGSPVLIMGDSFCGFHGITGSLCAHVARNLGRPVCMDSRFCMYRISRRVLERFTTKFLNQKKVIVLAFGSKYLMWGEDFSY
jgi:hypothetical protein